jgi:hypothetical protein
MKLSSSLALLIMSASAASAFPVSIYSENFSTQPLNTVFTNAAPWWSNGWGGGAVTTQALAEGPNGLVAMTRQQASPYNGVLRGPTVFTNVPTTGLNPADITISVWAKATNSGGGSLGTLGFTILSFAQEGGVIGNGYKALALTTDWAQYTFTAAELITAPDRTEPLIDWDTTVRIQPFMQVRGGIESPLPDGNVLTWQIADISITAVPEPRTFAAFAGLVVLAGVALRRRRQAV